ncbi:hypothetical protein OH76DRAFT_1412682 [Lentinus brumalis]|uniref:Secreted protein n=1 Tax=Lentinus brumalis TaxID=2498619 RepID=A0A371CKI8_9APHY|nr:hypothetical protein OH76DRAFT_1412682 [Polyporus brumalis]
MRPILQQPSWLLQCCCTVLSVSSSVPMETHGDPKYHEAQLAPVGRAAYDVKAPGGLTLPRFPCIRPYMVHHARGGDKQGYRRRMYRISGQAGYRRST